MHFTPGRACCLLALALLTAAPASAQLAGLVRDVNTTFRQLFPVLTATAENGVTVGTLIVDTLNATDFDGTIQQYRESEIDVMAFATSYGFITATITRSQCAQVAVNDSRVVAVLEPTNFLYPTSQSYGYCRNPPDYLDDTSASATCLTFVPNTTATHANGVSTTTPTNLALNLTSNYTPVVYNSLAVNLSVAMELNFRPPAATCSSGLVDLSNTSATTRYEPALMIESGYAQPGFMTETNDFTNATCAKIGMTLIDDPASSYNSSVTVSVLSYGPKNTYPRPHTSSPLSNFLTVNATAGGRGAKSIVVPLDSSTIYDLYYQTTSATPSRATRYNLTTVLRIALLNQANANCSLIDDSYVGVYSTPNIIRTAANPPSQPPSGSNNGIAITQSASTSSGISGGAIGGIIAGVVVVAAVVIAGFVVWRRRRRAQKGPRTGEGISNFDSLKDVEGGTTTWSNPNYNQEFKNMRSVIRHGQASSIEQTSTGGSSSNTGTSDGKIASFAVVKAIDGDTSAYLPAPQDSANEGIATVHIEKTHTGESQRSVGERGSSRKELDELWKIDPASLQCRCRKDGSPVHLGEGGCGKVYLGILDRQHVAVKIISSRSQKQQERFLREIMTLRACTHPHVVQFIGACVRENEMCLVMEFMSRGDLYSQLKVDERREYSWHTRGAQIILDAIKGLIYLHGRGIAHLDLKSPNIMLTAADRAKIGDVGLGKIISGNTKLTVEGASLLWAAPEQLLSGDVGTAADIFAFGVVLWEVCTGEQLRSRALREIEVPREAPRAVADLFLTCTASEPHDRPTATAVYDTLVAALSGRSLER